MKTIRLVTLLAVVIFTSAINSCAVAPNLSTVVYYPKLPSDRATMGKATTHMSDLFKKNLKAGVFITDSTTNQSFWAKDILVLDDRIEFNSKKQKSVFYFSKLLDRTIVAKGLNVEIDKYYTISLHLLDITNSQGLADDLFFMQRQQIKKRYDTWLVGFESLAAQYRALKVKPPVSEDQRRYIVQANALNQQKEYNKAIGMYNKAIELDRISYPTAYYNEALLFAQLKNYDAAIYCMKIYLLFEPDAPDSRSAQDKIYEWEIMINQ
ncbi:MAG: hypothetical protein Q7U08_09105 [Flavobacteriaceae bacterium]|jgi:tetratricopeptide (TPR) repeat protein|nr:hypothetical protein [Flavobacteriaceae bacterium]